MENILTLWFKIKSGEVYGRLGYQMFSVDAKNSENQ